MSRYEKLIGDARADRRLARDRGNQRHSLIEVKAPQRKESSPHRLPLNQALVIYASERMTGAPPEAALKAEQPDYVIDRQLKTRRTGEERPQLSRWGRSESTFSSK